MCSQSNTVSNNDTEDENDDVTVSDTVSDTLSDSGCSFGDWCKTFWIRIGYSIAYFIFYTIYGLLCFVVVALLQLDFKYLAIGFEYLTISMLHPGFRRTSTSSLTWTVEALVPVLFIVAWRGNPGRRSAGGWPHQRNFLIFS